jgi:hypothetical protein
MSYINAEFTNLSTGLIARIATLLLDGIPQRAQRTVPPLRPIPLEEKCLQLSEYRQDAVSTAPATIWAAFLFICRPLPTF